MSGLTKAKSGSLRTGRPPLIIKKLQCDSTSSSKGNNVNARRKSAKATRKLINTHHQLHKSRAAAVAAKDDDLVKEIDAQIEKLGGLQAYQAASLTGQDRERGGDSSEKLVEWLRKYGLAGEKGKFEHGDSLQILEIGALSSKNAISRMIGKGVDSVRRLDLHSQEPDTIEEIDFMDLPVPHLDADKFDIVSLSLVLNYVPDIVQRGEMLRRTTQFLRPVSFQQSSADEQMPQPLPCLFVVLPLPCLSNSRYMTHMHFVLIMRQLGFEMIEQHDSQKLAYMLFRWQGKEHSHTDELITFKKIELRSGKDRNNFAVVLRPG